MDTYPTSMGRYAILTCWEVGLGGRIQWEIILMGRYRRGNLISEQCERRLILRRKWEGSTLRVKSSGRSRLRGRRY